MNEYEKELRRLYRTRKTLDSALKKIHREYDVRSEIKRLHIEGSSLRELAERFGVSHETIRLWIR